MGIITEEELKALPRTVRRMQDWLQVELLLGTCKR
jgi:hypothetical protein